MEEPEIEDPCQTSLASILVDETLQEHPADVLISFVENYCTEAADIFMPSK